jgi:thiamine transport system ATP-binding protein
MSLRLDDVSVSFGTRRILDRLNLTVATGHTCALVGPSGVGKSTTLRVVAGIITPETGRVIVDDVDVTAVPIHRRSVGLVFQDDQLFPHLDVQANIAFGLRMAKLPRDVIARRVAELLEVVALPGFGNRRPDSLSGGEAKRVALARALAPRPRVLLLDEPLSGLDRDLHDRLVSDLADILAGTTTLLVTHDLDEAERLADEIIRLAPVAPRGQESS